MSSGIHLFASHKFILVLKCHFYCSVANSMFHYFLIRDDVVTKTAIGVLGDLADTLGSNAGPLISQAVASKDFLHECLSSDDHFIKESADWARLAITRAVSG